MDVEKKREYDRQRYEKKKDKLREQSSSYYYRKKLTQENIDKSIRRLERLGYKVEKIENINL